ncbi:peptidase inhibitor family I36 protein [Actinoplanes philippinensis]|uniref:peptidase inhibitor family I36 protein n=1 Tax=Actinoplanes philippinensis TaxID=35752 RepID=UPI0033FE4842
MVAFGVAVGLCATLIFATPAQAAKSRCNNYSGYLCTWTEARYGGLWAAFPRDSFSCWEQVRAFNSLWNRTSYKVRVWSGAACSGHGTEWQPGESTLQLGYTAVSYQFFR